MKKESVESIVNEKRKTIKRYINIAFVSATIIVLIWSMSLLFAYEYISESVGNITSIGGAVVLIINLIILLIMSNHDQKLLLSEWTCEEIDSFKEKVDKEISLLVFTSISKRNAIINNENVLNAYYDFIIEKNNEADLVSKRKKIEYALKDLKNS